jgi:hypothetical protein
MRAKQQHVCKEMNQYTKQLSYTEKGMIYMKILKKEGGG